MASTRTNINDLPVHLVTTVAPTPKAWATFLLDIISSQTSHGITLSDLFKTLMNNATSPRSAYNNQTPTYFPTSLTTTQYYVRHSFNPAAFSNISFQRFLFTLLRDGMLAEEIDVANEKELVETVVRSFHNNNNNKKKKKKKKNKDHSKEQEKKRDAPINFYIQTANENQILTPLTSAKRKTITFEECLSQKYIIRSSLYRRRKALSSSGVLHSFKSCQFSVMGMKRTGAAQTSLFKARIESVMLTGGDCLHRWRKALSSKDILQNQTKFIQIFNSDLIACLCLLGVCAAGSNGIDFITLKEQIIPKLIHIELKDMPINIQKYELMIVQGTRKALLNGWIT